MLALTAAALMLTTAGAASGAPAVKRTATLAVPAVISYGDTVTPTITTTGRETGSGYFYQYVSCSQPGYLWFSPGSSSRTDRLDVTESVTFTNAWGGLGSALDPSQPADCWWVVDYSYYDGTSKNFKLDELARVTFVLQPAP
jgi:hypothetical protein